MLGPMGKYGRHRMMTSDDPDAFEIDLDSLPTIKGTLLHFYELLPGDMFTTGWWYEPIAGIEVDVITSVYLGLGYYFSMSHPDDRGFIDPKSGMLVTLISRACMDATDAT